MLTFRALALRHSESHDPRAHLGVEGAGGYSRPLKRGQYIILVGTSHGSGREISLVNSNCNKTSL